MSKFNFFMLALLALALFLVGIAVYADRTGRSADERMAAIVPALWAVGLLVVDALLFLGRVVVLVWES